MKNLEEQMQIRLFYLLHLNNKMHPAFDLIYASANGGKRSKSTAARLKASGVKAGIPDIHFPMRSMGYNSLYIELKIPGNNETQIQADVRNDLNLYRNLSFVCFSFDEAFEVICNYEAGNKDSLKRYEWMQCHKGRIGINTGKSLIRG